MRNFVGTLKSSIAQNLNLELSKIPKNIIQQANEISLTKKDNDTILVINPSDKKFEYWYSQKKLIPPWEINWYQLKDKEYLTLNKGSLAKLINQGAKKAGNLNKLKKLLKVSELFVYYGSKGKTEIITIKNLRKLLLYLNIPYEKLNKNIVEIRKGRKASIKNPKFPINLMVPEGASLLGAIVSDGSISVDKKARNTVRTQYYAEDFDDVKTFIRNINKIFGEVFIRKKKERNCFMIRIGSSIIGDSLVKVGAIKGPKYSSEQGVPWIVKEGSSEMKKEYLKAVFTDEGSMGLRNFPYITLSRYNHLNKFLKSTHIKILDKFIEPKMKVRKISGTYIGKEISFGSVREILTKTKMSLSKELLSLISERGRPTILLDESSLLKDFEIENKIFITSLNKTKKGFYSAKSTLLIQRKKPIINFYKKINFLSTKKQEKLEKYLQKFGWL